jgi:hypothetical protein
MIPMTQMIQMMKLKPSFNVNIVIFICCFLLVSTASYSSCQSLEEFSRNQEFKDATRVTKRSLPFPAWLNPKSNYVELLTSIMPEEFFKKFINLQEGMTKAKSSRHKSIEYIGFSSQFFEKVRKDPIEMFVYMPHPAVFDLAENETLPSLLKFMPKPSAISDTSIIQVSDYQAKINQLNDSSFVIVVKLPMQVRIFVRSKDQRYLTHATELLTHANMSWLVEKLSS